MPHCILELGLILDLQADHHIQKFKKNQTYFTGATMKKCHFRMAKLLEPSLKRNRTVTDGVILIQTCSAGIKDILKFS